MKFGKKLMKNILKEKSCWIAFTLAIAIVLWNVFMIN